MSAGTTRAPAAARLLPPSRAWPESCTGHAPIKSARHENSSAPPLAGCPAADDAILCLSELASNSVLHSNSRKPGGTFTVRVTSHEGNYVHIEVEDNGGHAG